MDSFATLFAHMAPSANAFFAGNLCQSLEFTRTGHLHLLRGGRLTLTRDGAPDQTIAEPTLLFFPRGLTHCLIGDPVAGADLVCATVDLGGDQGSPIGQGLPDFIALPLCAHPALAPVCALLVGEGLTEANGRQAALDHLFDYLLILIVRHVVASGAVESGVLAGLADPRLSRALNAIHENPRRAWTLEDLANAAGMSRTRFAVHFRAIIGKTPMDYLAGWRMTIARQLLARGRQVKAVATSVGYDNAAAFARVFTRVIGRSPREFGRPQAEAGED